MNISTHFIKRISGFFGMLLLLTPLTVLAQTKPKVVVIPLLGDDVLKVNPLKNVITVAMANGNFSDPVAAVKSISDASAANPYLVVIGPGVYMITQTLVMKAYVDIVGSGENVTKIKGAISTGSESSSAIISGASNSTLSSLTVENTGGGGCSVALYNGSASPTVSNVTATASGGTFNYGIFNEGSSLTMTGVTATASGGAGNNFGVYNSSSSPTMTGVTAAASGGGSSIGLLNTSSSPTMTNVTVTSDRIAVSNWNSSFPAIRRSTIQGSNNSLYTESNCTATVSQSTLIGTVYGANNKCVACDNGSGTVLGATCQPPPP